MYYLNLDFGSSSVKAALVEIASGKSIGVVQEPETDKGMLALRNGWVEQDPDDWRRHPCKAYQNWKNELESILNK